MRIGSRVGPRINPAGFLLRDLLAGLSMAVLLGSLAVPTANRFKSRENSARCLNNQKQLIAAWQMYADDNSGTLVENYHGTLALGGYLAGDSRTSPWALGWLTWTTESDNTNVLFLRDAKYARLAPYLTKHKRIHKCPSDLFVSRPQAARGFKERVRSYAMNLTVGNGNATTGPWDGQMYAQARRTSDFLVPPPTESSVFLEEHPDSINDPALYPPGQNNWIDLPGNLHQGAATVSFADAHVEVHPWKGSIRNARVRFNFSFPTATPADAQDRAWLSYHSQRRTTRSY